MSGFAYRIHGGTAERLEIKQALAAQRQGDFLWVHLNTNDDHAQQWLNDEVQAPEYILTSLTTTESRPRCEAVGEGAFLNLRGRSTEELDTSDFLASIRMWATAGRVVSLTRMPLVAVDAVVKLVEEGRITDPGDLISDMATAITTDLDPRVAELGDELDDCEEALDADRVFELRRTVTKVRVAAIGYRRFLSPQRQALERLADLPCDWLHDDDRLHLKLAADRAARMAEELESIRERAALTHEALTDLRSEQLDIRSLTISVAAMVFLPLTFLTGLLGMNVQGIPYSDRPWAFDAVCAICAAMAVGITLYFVRTHWFRGR